MIPEPGQTYLSFSGFIILLGVVQGILLAITGLVQKQLTSRIKGLIFLFFTLILTEIFLNRTGYMYYTIQLVDFSEPFQFAVPPLIYFGILSLDPANKFRKWQLHFIPFILYFLYFIPYYLAPANFKEVSYYSTHHLQNPDYISDFRFYFLWGKVRMFQMHAFYLQATIYLIFCFQLLFRFKTPGGKFQVNNSAEIRWWLVFTVLISLLIIVVIAVKIIFIKDLGDHIIAFFITLTLYLSTITELLKHSMRQSEGKAGMEQHSSSPANEDKKIMIRNRLMDIMEHDKPYKDPLISLTRLARQIGEPSYLVSQVINEKIGTSFYDWVAGYRVEEAKRMLSDPRSKLYTIEQIAEEVGYNSKSAFNKAFRKFTGKTPSDYRQV